MGLGGFVDDINGDTWPDVFFSHSCGFLLTTGTATFRELTFKMPDPKYTLPSNINKDYAYYCGANTGDLDNDGDIDFVVGDHLPNLTLTVTGYLYSRTREMIKRKSRL